MTQHACNMGSVISGSLVAAVLLLHEGGVGRGVRGAQEGGKRGQAQAYL
eukprot:CAMPEP_0119109124 /NCGR_PEP_ID=MMETSP1180-20130426/17320_1 /TAXON_ID=3052 ORGANISM="Chlamydomonas cf sp, Strain CCMP681" /NCGR_SAMPLE_ID=MMETSP1180 /ASSEMBLY_ACC=CAM_ASM_000741 /LENGTH=48 /DNA_ID= /DNA_START= /DNA_END= /DNA_ORIENTATION=